MAKLQQDEFTGSLTIAKLHNTATGNTYKIVGHQTEPIGYDRPIIFARYQTSSSK
jgi:hypothetical protein